jgi:hypothetical protein
MLGSWWASDIWVLLCTVFCSLSPRVNYTDRATALLSVKSVSIFADKGCCVMSVMDPYGRILGFLNRSRYFFFQVAPQLYSRGGMNPVSDPLLLEKSVSAGNRTQTSGSLARNSEHLITEVVIILIRLSICVHVTSIYFRASCFTSVNCQSFKLYRVWRCRKSFCVTELRTSTKLLVRSRWTWRFDGRSFCLKWITGNGDVAAFLRQTAQGLLEGAPLSRNRYLKPVTGWRNHFAIQTILMAPTSCVTKRTESSYTGSGMADLRMSNGRNANWSYNEYT